MLVSNKLFKIQISYASSSQSTKIKSVMLKKSKTRARKATFFVQKVLQEILKIHPYTKGTFCYSFISIKKKNLKKKAINAFKRQILGACHVHIQMVFLPTMPAKSLGTLTSIYKVITNHPPLPHGTMLVYYQTG